MWPEFPEYLATIDSMENLVEDVISKKSNGEIWFLEYDDVYTGGSGSTENDIKNTKINIIQTNRGGKYTYHGKGQRVVYLIVDLHDIFGDKPDLKKYLDMIESWIIESLKYFDIKGCASEINRGVWCGQNKIAAIGIRLKKWVAYHGVAINVTTDLSNYLNFVPCGLDGFGVTSIENEIQNHSNEDLMKKLDDSMIQSFGKIFPFALS